MKNFMYYQLEIDGHIPSCANPYDENITAYVRRPDHSAFCVKGFYLGAGKYAIRVYMNQEGSWLITVVDNANKILDEKQVVCEAGEEKALGKARLNEQLPFSCETDNGTPLYFIGFEADWIFLIDQDQDDFSKAKTLIDSMAENQFNAVMCNVWANDVDWDNLTRCEAYEHAYPVMTPFSADDPNSLNERFFRRMDAIMDYFMEKGIYVHLMIYVWNKKVPWAPLFSELDNRYFTHIINRYAAYPNILWDISKEALSYGHCSMEDIQQKCKQVRALDPYGTLLTVHDKRFCERYSELVDIYSIQTWTLDLFTPMNKLYEKYPNHIVWNVEHGGYEKGPYHNFEGCYTEAEACLERNYLCLFAGTHNTYYWQDASWNTVIWDINDLPEAQRPHYEYFRYMSEYIKQMDLRNAKPSVQCGGCGFALDDGKALYVLKPTGMSRVRTGPKESYERASVQWFNPVTNEYKDVTNPEGNIWVCYDSPFGSALAIVRIAYKGI